MMQYPREQIYAAQFALFSGIAAFQTKSRIFIPWSKLPAEMQPAIMVVPKFESVDKNQHGVPLRWHLHTEVVIYANMGGDKDNTVPATILNPLVDAIEAACGDPLVKVQTLGDLIANMFISGKVESDEGVLGSQGWRVVPIEMIVPA